MNVILGIVVGSFGIKGDVKVKSCTDFATKRYKKGNVVKLVNPINQKEENFEILNYRKGKDVDILLLDKITNPEDALKYKGWQIVIEKPTDDLKENEYYFADLYNCKVFHNDILIGEVTDLINANSNLILRIKRNGKKDLLYPFVQRFIKTVDILNKKIDILPIEGMLD